MTDVEIRELNVAEIDGVAGAMINMPSVGLQVLRFLDRINYQFLGCTTSENGMTACSSTHDGPPLD